MDLRKVIKLTTTKGEEVIVNFNNVSYCHKTNNNHTSLRFTYAQGKENKGVYLIVSESVDTIQKILNDGFNIKLLKIKQG